MIAVGARPTRPLRTNWFDAQPNCASNQLVGVVWTFPSSSTVTSKQSIGELHFHARRGVEMEISLMLNRCALHDSRIDCA